MSIGHYHVSGDLGDLKKMKMKTNTKKIKIVRSLLSLCFMFLFTLPTLAAFDINYKNLFKIPNLSSSTSSTNVTSFENYKIAQDPDATAPIGPWVGDIPVNTAPAVESAPTGSPDCTCDCSGDLAHENEFCCFTTVYGQCVRGITGNCNWSSPGKVCPTGKTCTPGVSASEPTCSSTSSSSSSSGDTCPCPGLPGTAQRIPVGGICCASPGQPGIPGTYWICQPGGVVPLASDPNSRHDCGPPPCTYCWNSPTPHCGAANGSCTSGGSSSSSSSGCTCEGGIPPTGKICDGDKLKTCTQQPNGSCIFSPYTCPNGCDPSPPPGCRPSLECPGCGEGFFRDAKRCKDENTLEKCGPTCQITTVNCKYGCANNQCKTK